MDQFTRQQSAISCDSAMTKVRESCVAFCRVGTLGVVGGGSDGSIGENSERIAGFNRIQVVRCGSAIIRRCGGSRRERRGDTEGGGRAEGDRKEGTYRGVCRKGQEEEKAVARSRVRFVSDARGAGGISLCGCRRLASSTRRDESINTAQ